MGHPVFLIALICRYQKIAKVRLHFTDFWLFFIFENRGKDSFSSSTTFSQFNLIHLTWKFDIIVCGTTGTGSQKGIPG